MSLSIDFYDAIANEYDEKMDHHIVHSVRSKVSSYFKSIQNIQNILDFGAGTGEDLKWQLEAGFKVTFYEPSSNMANVARSKYNPNDVPTVFFNSGDNATLEKLRDHENVPFDAIFSNFAVLNSIKDLSQLFSSFNEIIKPSGHFVFIVYDNLSLPLRLYTTIKEALRPHKTSKFSNLSHNNQEMKVYRHSSSYLKSAAKTTGWAPLKKEKIGKSGHTLYHFRKDQIS